MVALLSGYISSRPQITYEGTVTMTTSVVTVYFPKPFRRVPAVGISPLSTGFVIISTVTTSYFVVMSFTVSSLVSVGGHTHYLEYSDCTHAHTASIYTAGAHTHDAYLNWVSHSHSTQYPEEYYVVPVQTFADVSLAKSLIPLTCETLSMVTGASYFLATKAHSHLYTDFREEHTHTIAIMYTAGSHSHTATIDFGGWHSHICYGSGGHEHAISISPGTISFVWSAIEI